MSTNQPNRREFINKSATATAGLSIASSALMTGGASAAEKGKLAILGGKPVRTKKFPSWPMIEENDREVWKKVLEEKGWCRLDGHFAGDFEKAYAKATGTKHCVATANGTSALFASLNAADVGPGDEVIVPPYTFVATINVVLLQHALPIFVDTDRETGQMDARKIEAAITDKTRVIMPVHLGGNACDMDAIMAISRKHNIPVIEDTCQSHFAEWRGKKLGSYGLAGCFSFQVTKNLSGGEGGAIITDDSKFAQRCYSFHNNGRGRVGYGFAYPHGGANLRLTEFQSALLLQQMTRVEAQSQTREQNAAYLTKQLEEIPGVEPARMYEGCTRNAYHLYMFRYDPAHFSGVPRAKFLAALRREGIPGSGGYGPLNTGKFLKETLNSRGYQLIYGKERIEKYWEQNQCPENDQLCQEAVWFGQTTLLTGRSDMDQIAGAIRKIYKNSRALSQS